MNGSRKLVSFRSEFAFTLIELLVVIAIISILMAATIIAINPGRHIGESKDAAAKDSISQIATAMKAYYTEHQYYPSSVADLVTAGELTSEPKDSNGNPFNIVLNPSSCLTTNQDCQNVAVYYTLNVPDSAGDVWCWRSSTGTASEVLPANCIP